MIYPNYVESVPDCRKLGAGQLVLCQSNVSSFAITCRIDRQPRIVLLADEALPGVRGPLVAAFESGCVTFGDRFVVGYDAKHLVPNDEPEVGDLVIRKNGLQLVALLESEPCLVDLSSGEVGAFAPGVVARVWSIAVDTWMTGKLVEVHWRG